MGFPHQVLPAVAALDAVSATISAVHLGLVPLPAFLTVKGTPTVETLFARLRGAASATRLTSHTIYIEKANPKKLLFIMLAACIARCCVIFIIWASIRKGIQGGRTGSRSEDYSGRAIGYSAVCVVSILLNLSILNLLFQTRGAPPNGSLMAVLLHMSSSSLAGEQLIISAVEWILFLLIVGTNGLRSGPSGSLGEIDQRVAPITTQTPSTSATGQDGSSAVPVEEEEEEEGISQKPAEIERGQDSSAPLMASQESQISSKKKDYGALSQATPAADPEQNAVTTAASAPDTYDESPASTSTSNDDSERPSAVSSDIVDIPRDRTTSMLGAKERLLKARESGKVRRRSLWKKIRGKNDAANADEQTAS